jgi:hypothetical protein
MAQSDKNRTVSLYEESRHFGCQRSAEAAEEFGCKRRIEKLANFGL